MADEEAAEDKRGEGGTHPQREREGTLHPGVGCRSGSAGLPAERVRRRRGGGGGSERASGIDGEVSTTPQKK